MVLFPLLTAPRFAPHARAVLQLGNRQAVPAKPFLAAVEIHTDSKWHVYWSNPGDSGIPTKVEWQVPSGWKAVPLPLPIPERFAPGGVVAYGYEGTVPYLAKIVPAPNARPGTYSVRANVAWLVCSNACIPGKAAVRANVQIGAREIALPAARALQTSQSGLPRPVSGWRFRAWKNAKNVFLEATPPSSAKLPLGTPTLFPFETGVIDHAQLSNATRKGRILVVTSKASPFPEKRARFSGLLVAPSGTSWAPGVRAMVFDAPLIQGDRK